MSGNDEVEIDARLSRPSKINLNYVSPYRYRSAVYAGYRGRSLTTTSTYLQTRNDVISTSVSPKNFVVTKSENYHTYDENPEIPTYSTISTKSRGKMLIINNIMYGQRNYRAGAEVDGENLLSVFTDIGFNVIRYNDLTKAQIISGIEDFRDRQLRESPDIMILVIMSHGDESKVLMNSTIESADHENIDIEDILQMFDEEKCGTMKGKPKIFIFQCCRGAGYHIQVDSNKVVRKAALTDALIAYSTLPGFVSFRNPRTGSWYISTLCKVFSEYAHKYDIENLLKMIDTRISNDKPETQPTHYESRSFKRCYLNPICKKNNSVK